MHPESILFFSLSPLSSRGVKSNRLLNNIQKPLIRSYIITTLSRLLHNLHGNPISYEILRDLVRVLFLDDVALFWLNPAGGGPPDDTFIFTTSFSKWPRWLVTSGRDEELLRLLGVLPRNTLVASLPPPLIRGLADIVLTKTVRLDVVDGRSKRLWAYANSFSYLMSCSSESG